MASSSYVGVGRGESMLSLLVGRGKKRIESELRGAVPPDGLAVQHAGQHREARISAVLAGKPRHQVPAAALLSAVVGARVLVGVLVQPARGGSASRRAEQPLCIENQPRTKRKSSTAVSTEGKNGRNSHEAPNEPMESVKQIRRAPTVDIASRTFSMPPTVTASATAGSMAVSTDSGAARFQTVVVSSAWSRNSDLSASASHTSTAPMQVPKPPMASRRLPGSSSILSDAITRVPRAVSAAQSRFPTAPAAPMIRVAGAFAIARDGAEPRVLLLVKASHKLTAKRASLCNRCHGISHALPLTSYRPALVAKVSAESERAPPSPSARSVRRAAFGVAPRPC